MDQSRIHVRTIRLVSLLLLLLAGVAGAAASRPASIIAATPPQPLFHATQPLAGLAQNETPVTTITVTTVTDNDNLSLSETCASVAADPQDSRCTLRRAIVQARTLPADQRPVLIAFDLPASESNDAADPAYWQMQVTGGSVQSPLGSTTGANLDGGQIILDGTTQPGGRTDGPKVFIPGTPQFDRLVIDDESNIIRGVGFLGLRLIFNGSTNLVEQSWLGLTPDGQQIYLVNDDPIRDNNAAIEEAESSEGNSFRDNVIAGGRTHAISKRGNNGTITNNLIGTRSDGTVPEVAANRKCRPNAQFFNWFGGGGIMVSGEDNQVGGPADLSNVLGIYSPSRLPVPCNRLLSKQRARSIWSITM